MRLSDLMQQPRPAWSDPCQCACGCGRHHMHTVLRGGKWFHSMQCMERGPSTTENEMAQTPGPWSVSKAEPHVVIGGNNQVVVHGLIGDQEDQDNARLIAKSQKLLELVKLLTDFAQDAHGLDFNEDRTSSWVAVVTADARKVIAEVEG